MLSPSSTRSFSVNGYQGRWTHPQHESTLTKKLFRYDWMECGAKLSRQPSPKARSGGWVEASCSLICGSRTSSVDAEQCKEALECSLALEAVAAEARLCVAQQQTAGTRPWKGTHDPADADILPDEQRS